MRVEVTVKNNLKVGGTEKRGWERKILKRGQASSRGGCLITGVGDWNPLRTKGEQEGGAVPRFELLC